MNSERTRGSRVRLLGAHGALGLVILLTLASFAAPALRSRPAQDSRSRTADAAQGPTETQRLPAATKTNTLPFENVARKGKEMADRGLLTKDTTGEVNVAGELKEDGSLDPPTVTMDVQASDEHVIKLTEQLVNAISESRVLSTLTRLGAKAVRMSFKLDRQTALLRVSAEVESATKADEAATGYGMMLAAARRTKEGTDEGTLLNGLRASAEGKEFAFTFEMQRDALAKMIADMLARKAAREAERNQ